MKFLVYYNEETQRRDGRPVNLELKLIRNLLIFEGRPYHITHDPKEVLRVSQGSRRNVAVVAEHENSITYIGGVYGLIDYLEKNGLRRC